MSRKRLYYLFFLIPIVMLFFRSPDRISPRAESPHSPSPHPANIAGPVAKLTLVNSAPAFLSDSSYSFLIAGWIQEDRYCGANGKTLVMQGDLESRPHRNLILYDALRAASGDAEPSACTQAMLSLSRAEALGFARKSQDLPCRLLEGLILTGQWGNAEASTEQEKQTGQEILHSLASEDPENGFFAFFELGAMDNREGSDRERVYLDMLHAPRFASPFLPLLQKLALIAQKNVAAFLDGAEIFGSVGVPNYGRGLKAASAFASQGIYPKDFALWVEGLGSRFLKAEELELTEPYLSLLEDAILRGVALSGRASIGKIPEILEQKRWTSYYHRRTAPTDISSAISEDCEKTVEKTRAIYPRIKADYQRQADLF